MAAQKKSTITLDDAQQQAWQQLCAVEAMLQPRRLFARKHAQQQGLYLYGDVGRGKSMLMDRFFDSIQNIPKRRVHFHAFMQEVHQRIHQLRADKSKADYLPRVAREIAKQARLLCFDEMQVKDIADAMILSRFFEHLFAAGVVVVTTSNRPPEDLYKDGLKRENFLPFIALLREKMAVHALEGAVDYRSLKLRSLKQTYITPIDAKTPLFFKKLFATLSNNQKPEPMQLEVNGRELKLPRTSAHVAWCRFDEVCAQALSAADYLAIAQEFDTVLLEDIPKLSPARRNEALRFITLIDVLYEQKVHLICSAEASPEKLYPKGDNRFEFSRTISRLIEMQSTEYLAANTRIL